ncbi:MAG: M24 family metallopeptidase [Candidatus Limivivens sp.]|nr:M24 family metallopeptidase [Candidatus Limivivens sp.]
MDITKAMVAGWECRYYQMPHKELENRRNAVRRMMEEKELDVLMLIDMVRGGYFQWFLGAGISERPTEEILIFTGKGEMKICLTSECFSDEQQKDYRKIDAVNSQDARFGDAQNVPALYYRYLSDALTRNRKVGILFPDSLRRTVKEYLEEHIPGLTWVDVTHELHVLKAVKSEEERKILRDMADFHDRLFETVGMMAIPGRLEGDLVKELRYRAYQMGCGGEDVTRNAVVWLTSGQDGKKEKLEEAVYPGKRLEEGDRINLKVQCVGYDDYYGILGRSFVLGEASEETKKDWESLVKVQDFAASLLKPGTTLKEAAEKVNGFRKEEGMAEDHSNFLYGVGYLPGEAPNLAYEEEMILQEGMVIAIAPELKKEGAETMYCADLYEITADRAIRMNAYPRKTAEIFIQ